MIKFLEHRIADKRILRLVRKWLKAGVIEEGNWSETPEGTPQGSLCSAEHKEPYERWVMDSVGVLSLVGTMVAVEHCA